MNGNSDTFTNGELAGMLDGKRPPIFLALGGPSPNLDGAQFHNDIGAPFDGVVLLGLVTAATLAGAMEAAHDPAAPIADFGGNRPIYSDFSQPLLTGPVLSEMKQKFTPIWRRLVELPQAVKGADRDDLLILRLAYSRNIVIEPAYTTEARAIVEYPLLSRIAGARRHLEVLADLQLLNRRHFTRTNTCKTCNSARLNIYEACPACGGANLAEENIVQHYRCGCQEPESHFAQGELLVCPKCRRVLRHLGMDYGKPGKAFVCQSCGSVNSQPDVKLACLDCHSITPSNESKTVDWWSYEVTGEGAAALRRGMLPRFEIAALLERRTHAYAPREFALLAMHEVRRSRRYKYPFAVIHFSFPNIEALRSQIGFDESLRAFDIAVDAIVRVLRESDFVGVYSQLAAMVGLPETTGPEANEIADRIRQTVSERTKAPIELAIRVAEGDDVTEFLEQA